MKAVPVFEAKNRLSELIAAVEQGDQVTITRRGVPVARLVAEAVEETGSAAQRQRVATALERLRQIRDGLVFRESDHVRSSICYLAIPINTARQRPTSSMTASPAEPNTLPSLSRFKVMALSTIT